MGDRAIIPFFTDNDVADSVGVEISNAGHKLTRLRDVMLTDSPDEVVATACREDGLVLVTHNWKDFRKILKADAALSERYANSLCRVEMRCQQHRAAARLKTELPIILQEWERRLANPDQPMWVEIGDEYVRVSRAWIRAPDAKT